MYKNYIFDLYGTLIDVKCNEDKDDLWDKFRLFLGYYGATFEKEELKDKYFKAKQKLMKLNEKTSYADIEIEDVFYKLYRSKEVKIKKKLTRYTARAFRMLTTEDIHMLDGIEKILKQLKEKNKNIFILCNGQAVYVASELKLFNIRDYFDGVLCSSECGAKLPNNIMYDKFFKEFNLDKKESVIISNDFTNVIKSAKEYQLDSIYVYDNQEENKKGISQTKKGNWDILFDKK